MDSPYHNKRTGGSTKSIGPVLKENDAFFWIVRFIDEESSEATLQTGKTVPESESTALFTFGSQLQSSWLEYTCWEPSVATKPKMGMGDKRKWLSVQKMVQRTKSGQAAAPWPQRSKKVWQKMPLFGIFVHFLADKASFLKTLVLLENWACLWLLRPTHLPRLCFNPFRTHKSCSLHARCVLRVSDTCNFRGVQMSQMTRTTQIEGS